MFKKCKPLLSLCDIQAITAPIQDIEHCTIKDLSFCTLKCIDSISHINQKKGSVFVLKNKTMHLITLTPNAFSYQRDPF